jgi:uncharacterized protein (TIGR03084 family)
MKEICNDLAQEGQQIEDLVAALDEDQWHRVTPFAGWTIKDEIAHIAFFDRMARLSASDQTAFNAVVMELARDMANFFSRTMAEGRAMPITDLRAWWQSERHAMLAALESLNPKTRVPWQLPMSARSLATARLMELWAHGQDIFDALQLKREPTRRLRHIAHLGVVTFDWSFSCHGQEVPSEPVRLELLGPTGEIWTWGPETGQQRIEGEARDFCLVVTQRRHYQDTGLKVTGPVAQRWMELAQVFAGPPASGPPAGTFTKS